MMDKSKFNHYLVMFLTLEYFVNLVCSMNNVPRPNIIIMLADDLGYGDLGCFGNTSLRTPNIDKMANEGVKLTHHLAAASVCSPSRAALLTGRYPIRSGMYPDGIVRVNLFIANRGGLPPSEVTFAKILKEAGYKTALIGKWHLGMSRDHYNDFVFHPLNHGFDYYYGHILTNVKDFSGEGDRVLLSLLPNLYKGIALAYIIGIITFYLLFKKGLINKTLLVILTVLVTFLLSYFILLFENLTTLNSVLMRNFDVVEQPIQLESLMSRYVSEGLEYLQQRKNDGSPFLLFLSWDRVHTAFKIPKEFRGKSKHGRYGDAVEELDWGTGQIMSAVKSLELDKNTLVYFTSDNGGGKAQGAVDGGIRVPAIVWSPKLLPSNITQDEPTSQMDILPTLSYLTNSDVPKDRIIDGKNIFSLLKGDEVISPHQYFFHYCGSSLHAIRFRPRTGKKVWKLVFYEPDYLPGKQECTFICSCSKAHQLNPPELFELTSNPGETKPLNISSNKDYEIIVESMLKAKQEHEKSAVPAESQVTFYKVMWWPHLQPCCNFPYCSCKDTKFT
ncbi:hypothetical protein KUTeg_008709 [Tegillarca granosa]|uniref:Sulfatase N-terminal domain-containing protein n=1 Tax=Tegillarca granosa TaxID=220873 RepID=A0ABQ9F9U8_TEGGR|nr:hypothetical protein KUTeg_008709 [Tegillarca granosa]